MAHVPTSFRRGIAAARPILWAMALGLGGVVVGTFPVWSPFSASSTTLSSPLRGIRDEPMVLPPFSFRDQRGARVSERDLRGHVWIANFIFTQCAGACPILTGKLVALELELSHPRLRFVSFSVDPEHDSPEVLANYAGSWNGGESRWLLLSTDRRGIDAFSVGLGAALQPSSDVQNPILHTSRFFLMDGSGSVRGVYDSSEEPELSRLIADVNALSSEANTSPE